MNVYTDLEKMDMLCLTCMNMTYNKFNIKDNEDIFLNQEDKLNIYNKDTAFDVYCNCKWCNKKTLHRIFSNKVVYLVDRLQKELRFDYKFRVKTYYKGNMFTTIKRTLKDKGKIYNIKSKDMIDSSPIMPSFTLEFLKSDNGYNKFCEVFDKVFESFEFDKIVYNDIEYEVINNKKYYDEYIAVRYQISSDYADKIIDKLLKNKLYRKQKYIEYSMDANKLHDIDTIEYVLYQVLGETVYKDIHDLMKEISKPEYKIS